MRKECTGCTPDNGNSFAMELLKGYSAQAKRWFAISLVILAMWLSTIGGFVWYLYQYDFENYEMIVEQDGEGINNYIGKDGDIMDGAKSNR